MELLPWASFLSVVLAPVFVLVAALCRRNRRRKYKLPPGPRQWPVIGNLHQISPLPNHSLRAVSAQFGPLMSLCFGAVTVVVGSSVATARSILQTNDLALIDRPRTATGKHTAYDHSNVLWSLYGDYWRQARRLWQMELLGARQLKLHERARGEEVCAMLHDLRAAAEAGRAVALKEHLMKASLNVISRVVLGRKYAAAMDGSATGSGSETVATLEELGWMIDEMFFLSGKVIIGDVIPWLGWLDPHGYVARMKRLGKALDRFLEKVLDEHEERKRREGEAFVARDLVDKLLQVAGDPDIKVPITRDGVKAFTLELFAAGTDTSAATVEWAMSELLRNPSTLARATDELDRVVGRARLVAEADIPRLPYVEAVVKETMRLHPVSPLLMQRQCREDASVCGFDVPAGTRVLVNFWSIGRDPAVWDAPLEFRPERFLGSAAAVDVRGHDFELLPFGSGRRMCPGLNLGLKMVHLGVANLLHGFAWRLPGGVSVEEMSMEERFGLSLVRKVPLEVVAEPKLPAHLYAESPAS